MNWDCWIPKSKSYMIFDVKQLPGWLWYSWVYSLIKLNDLTEECFVGLRTQSNFMGFEVLNQLLSFAQCQFWICLSKILDERTVGFWERSSRSDKHGPTTRTIHFWGALLSLAGLLHFLSTLPNVHQMHKSSVWVCSDVGLLLILSLFSDCKAPSVMGRQVNCRS